MATATVNGDLSLVTDSYLSVSTSGKALLPVDMKLRAAYGFGTGFDKARVIAPSLKRVGYPRLQLFEQVTVPADLPAVCLFDENPLLIRRNEEFNFQVDNTDAGTQRQNVLAFLQDREDTYPAGPSYTIFGTATITTVAYQWVQGTITWEDTYPTVPFAVIGMRAVGTNLMAARLIPQSGTLRPGCIGTATERTDDRSFTWGGKFGKLCEFTPPTFPNVEVLGQAAAATAHRFYLQVVPLAGIP